LKHSCYKISKWYQVDEIIPIPDDPYVGKVLPDKIQFAELSLTADMSTRPADVFEALGLN
jgi:hypothetical protein